MGTEPQSQRVPTPDAITVPKGYLGINSTERQHLEHFAHVFNRPADVLEIYEIPGTATYLIGPVGTGIAFASPGYRWQAMPNRIQVGYLNRA